MRSKIGNLMGSVATKILAIMLALVGTTVAAIWVSGSLISTIDRQAEVLATDSVPPLETATGISNAVSGLKDAVTALLVTHSHLAIGEALDTVNDATQDLADHVAEIDTAKYPQMTEEMEILTRDLSTLEVARRDELATLNRNQKALAALNQETRTLSVALEDAISRASFSLAMASNSATAKSNRAVRNLLKHDAEALRLTLMLKIALTQYAADVQALVNTYDLTMKEKLQIATAEDQARVTELLGQMKKNKVTRPFLADLQKPLDYQAEFLSLPPAKMKIAETQVRIAQEELEAKTSEIVTQLLEQLSTESEATLTENERTLKSLIDQDVGHITDLAHIDSTVKMLLIKAMQATSSNNVGYIRALQMEIDDLIPDLRKRVDGQPAELTALINSLLEKLSPETGMLATQLSTLEARGSGYVATEAVAHDLLRVSDVVLEISTDSLQGIEEASSTLVATAQGASKTMNGIALIALVIVLIAPVLTYFFIMRPLSAVTASTERLAVGDMGEITRVGGRYGEIARLFSALTVFRNNLVEKEQMEAEAAERKEREAEAAAQAEREKHEREAAELARQQEQEKREREREAAAEAERRALEEAAEAERKARHEEQTAVVQSLADGLRRMSQGDVRYTIDQEFPGSYEQLRQDYNAAVISLRDVIDQLAVSSQTIQTNSSEISNAATDLSHRTERAASTLGETASALTELTAAVKSAADGAAQANTTVAGAKSNAQSASEVVKDAISAMDAISDSSDKISKIISVIDDIAFQTNLLALNAGVEAARAGEAGRGFAVVASEVRALAQRSSEAAREINTLISVSGQEVGRGVTLVDQTGEALRSIVDDVTAISNHMAEIATSAEQQSAGISEINTAVANLDQTTQQNAAMFEETTAASVSLAHEASSLGGIVSKFQIDGEDIPASAPTSTESDGDLSIAS